MQPHMSHCLLLYGSYAHNTRTATRPRGATIYPLSGIVWYIERKLALPMPPHLRRMPLSRLQEITASKSGAFVKIQECALQRTAGTNPPPMRGVPDPQADPEDGWGRSSL